MVDVAIYVQFIKRKKNHYLIIFKTFIFFLKTKCVLKIYIKKNKINEILYLFSNNKKYNISIV